MHRIVAEDWTSSFEAKKKLKFHMISTNEFSSVCVCVCVPLSHCVVLCDTDDNVGNNTIVNANVADATAVWIAHHHRRRRRISMCFLAMSSYAIATILHKFTHYMP